MNMLRTGANKGYELYTGNVRGRGAVQRERAENERDKPKRAGGVQGEGSMEPRASLRARMFGLWPSDAAVVARFAVAILLVELSGTVLNGGVYPRLASYFGIGRELSTLMNGAAFLAVGLLAALRPTAIDARRISRALVPALLVAGVLLGFAVIAHDPVLTVVALAVRAVGNSWAFVVLAVALVRLSDSRMVLVLVGAGAVLSNWGFLVIPFELGAYASAFAVMLCAIGPIALVGFDSEPFFARIRQASTAEALGIDRLGGPTVLRDLALCMLFVSIGSGFGITFNELNDSPQVTVIDGMLLAVVVLTVVVFEPYRRKHAVAGARTADDALFTVTVLCVLAGSLVALLSFGQDTTLANVLLRVGRDVFNMLVWLVVYSIGRRNVFALIPLLASMRVSASLGVTLGASGGHLANDLIAKNPFAAQCFVAAFVFLFVAFLWVGFRDFSFGRLIEGVQKVEERDVARMSDFIDERCAELAAAYGLTARESEILGQLARGRDGKFIAGEYVLSYNTVKTHIKHIYQKAGVHSRQELLDAVEAGRVS